jgi:hypothetical protein
MSDRPAKRPDPLAPLRGKLPQGWECWVGAGGTLYARKRRTSPPVVFRAAGAEALAVQVRQYEAGLPR